MKTNEDYAREAAGGIVAVLIITSLGAAPIIAAAYAEKNHA